MEQELREIRAFLEVLKIVEEHCTLSSDKFCFDLCLFLSDSVESLKCEFRQRVAAWDDIRKSAERDTAERDEIHRQDCELCRQVFLLEESEMSYDDMRALLKKVLDFFVRHSDCFKE